MPVRLKMRGTRTAIESSAGALNKGALEPLTAQLMTRSCGVRGAVTVKERVIVEPADQLNPVAGLTEPLLVYTISWRSCGGASVTPTVMPADVCPISSSSGAVPTVKLKGTMQRIM